MRIQEAETEVLRLIQVGLVSVFSFGKKLTTAEVAAAQILDKGEMLALVGVSTQGQESGMRGWDPELRLSSGDILRHLPDPELRPNLRVVHRRDDAASEAMSQDLSTNRGRGNQKTGKAMTSGGTPPRKPRAPSPQQKVIESWLVANRRKTWPDISDRAAADQITEWHAGENKRTPDKALTINQKVVETWRNGPRHDFFVRRQGQQNQ